MNDDHNPSEGEDHPSYDETDAVDGEGESKLSHRQLLYQELDRLVIEASQHPPGFTRKRYLSQIVTKIQNSGLICQNHKNEPFYQDALQDQWEFFCNNLWEARTGTQYDRTRSNPITWFNNCLKWRLLTLTLKRAKENKKICNNEQLSPDGELIDLIKELPDRDESHILEYIREFEEVKNWIETNPDGVLSEHIRGRKDLTCQVILRSLSSGKTFSTIALEFGCPYPTLYGFYKKKCRHHLQEFRENHGY